MARKGPELRRLGKMLLLRRFEEQVRSECLKSRPPIGGYIHLYTGQEAIAVGASEVFRRGLDVYAGSFRCHGWALALGMSPRAAMAEIFGQATGCCGGKAGSMHLADAATGNLGGWYAAGAQMPIGAGAAFAAAYRKTGGVAFVVFGDGAIDQGVCAESLNLAGLFKLPAAFLLEDNGVALGTKVERHSAEPDLVRRGQGFAMPCRGFDGNDIEEVIRQVGQAADRARRGQGPSYLVARTFRQRGFSMSDPMRYRTKQEQEQGRQRDPIVKYTQLLTERGTLEDATLDRLRQEARDAVDDAVEFASTSENPSLEQRWSDVVSRK